MDYYLAGTFSGICETSITFPIDTIKTRLQSGKSISSSLSKQGIYRGFTSKLISIPLSRTVFWGAKDHIMRETGNIYLSSFSAGFLQSIIDTPFERYKINQQISASSIKQSYQQKTTFAFQNFWKGLTVTSSRNIPFAMGYFCLSENLNTGYDTFDRSIAAFSTAFITQPLDTIKTMVQSDSKIDILKLMKGAIPRSIFTTMNLVIGHTIYKALLS